MVLFIIIFFVTNVAFTQEDGVGPFERQQKCLRRQLTFGECVERCAVYDFSVPIGYCFGSEGYIDFEEIKSLYCTGRINHTRIDFGMNGMGCNIKVSPVFLSELKECLETCRKPFLEKNKICNDSYNNEDLWCDEVERKASCECIRVCFMELSQAPDYSSKCPPFTGKKVPLRNQNDPNNRVLGKYACGPTALGMALEYFGKNISTMDLIKEMNLPSSGAKISHLVKTANKYLPKSHFSWGTAIGRDSLAYLEDKVKSGHLVIVPVEGQYTEDMYAGDNHYLLVTDFKDGNFFINDPGQDCPIKISSEKLKEVWVKVNGKNPAVVIRDR